MTDEQLPPSHVKWKRRDLDKWRGQVAAATRARRAAVLLLIEENQDRFDYLYALTAAEEGITPRRRLTEAEKLERQIAKLQKELRKVRNGGSAS